jgi:hypothetical protein
VYGIHAFNPNAFEKLRTTGHSGVYCTYFNMTYTIPDIEWPMVNKTVHPVLLSEKYGTTNGRWYIPIQDKEVLISIRTLLTSYKVPIYHLMIDEFQDSIARYVYVWTFSAPKTPVVHVYYQEGSEITYEKTLDAMLLLDSVYECNKIITRMQEL